MLHRGLLAMGVITVLALTGCGGGGGETDTGALSVTVKGLDSFSYDPAALTGRVGQAINLTLENTGVLEHNFVIDEFNLHLGPIQGGQSSSGSLTPNTAGTFTYYCDVPGHREAGMEGTLTVTP
jgi:plastocyanin